MENIEKVAEMAFHGVTYLIKITTRDDVLFVEIEQKDTGDTWKNSFTANYIEEISQKTGNYKKFSVFVKMLLSSISKNSDAVFLDILTFQDLEMLKARKHKANTSMSTTQDKIKNNKRYMIMTYSVEYDKVHYPLPLNFEENPDVETLKNTIRRLRMEMEEVKVNQTKTVQNNDGFFMTQDIGGEANKSSELILMKVENENLKEKIKRLEETGVNQTTKRVGAVQHELELKSKMEVENELEDLKKEYVRDVKRLKAKLEETEIQLEKTKEELSRAGSNGLDSSGRKLNKDEELELAHSKKLVARYQAENEKLTQELEGFKDLDRKQKVRIKQLETDLESALKRVNYSRGSNQSGGSPYNRSRGNSPGNSASKRYNSTPSNYSPGPRVADKKVVTPVRGRGPVTSPSPKGTPTRSTSKTYNYGGTSRERTSPMTRTATVPNPINKRTTPQRTNQRDAYGSGAKKSPQPMRNLSPSNNKPNTYSPSNSKMSPGNRFGMRNNYVAGGNLQRKDLENSLRNKSKNSNLTDSGDEASYQRRDLSSKNQSLNSILSSNRNVKGNAYTNNINTIQQKLKENIHDFKESKTSKGPERPAQHIPETTPEMNDIGDRLNKLQDLLKRAKS